MKFEFNIERFPYPIAQSFSYVPKHRDRIKKIGPAEAVQRAVTCFETICRFCLWEMMIEYSILDEKNDKLNQLLSNSLFFSRRKGLATGSLTQLMKEVSRYLLNFKGRLFITEMPFLYFSQKGNSLSSVGQHALEPFPNERNRVLGHLNTHISADEKASHFMGMYEKLLLILKGLSFLENYALISAIQIENNILKEAYILDGVGKTEPDVWQGRIEMTKDQKISKEMTLLIRRNLIESTETGFKGSVNNDIDRHQHSFLLYPLFLFGAFQSSKDSEEMESEQQDEIYILNSVGHNKENISKLVFCGHKANCVERQLTPSRGNPLYLKIIEEFRNFLKRLGIVCRKENGEECKDFLSRLELSPFDLAQEDRINSLLKIYLERPEVVVRVDTFLQQGVGCLVVKGEPGSGKSSLAAYLIRNKKDGNHQVAYHLIGPTVKGWKQIVSSLIHQIYGHYEDAFNNRLAVKPDMLESLEDESIIRFYHEVLSRTNAYLGQSNQKLLIILDALDELVESFSDLERKNIFEFVPEELPWGNIHFIITTRPGPVFKSFSDHMGMSFPEIIELQRMNVGQLEALACLCGLNVSPEEVKIIFSVTHGNPLYLSSIFKKLKADRNFNLSGLPESVLAFFRKDLLGKYRIRNNDLLKDILGTIRILRIQPSVWHLNEILEAEGLTKVEKMLLRISSYLLTSTKGTYSFFHPKFSESLTHGEDPILSKEDLIHMHQKVIDWCEPFESLNENDPQFEYGFEYLPHHYWKLEKFDNLAGFSGFIGRGNINCEISGRIFLRDVIISRPENVVLQDDDFNKKLERLFLGANNHGKTCLLKIFYDLAGYGYTEYLRVLGERFIRNFEIGDYWFNEIVRFNENVFGMKRTQIVLEILKEPEKITCLNQLRALYVVGGSRLCNINTSVDKFDPEMGLALFEKAREILDNLKIEDLTLSCCDDPWYAKWYLDFYKAAFHNSLALSLKRIGDIDNAIDNYEKSISFKEANLSLEQASFLKDKTVRSISITKHNFGYLLILRGRYVAATEMFNNVLTERAINRRSGAFLKSINLTRNIFLELGMEEILFFIMRLVSRPYSGSLAAEIGYHSRSFQYHIRRSNIKEAEQFLSNLILLREKRSDSFVFKFRNLRDLLQFSVTIKDREKTMEYLNRTQKIVIECGENHVNGDVLK